jgi:Ni,Fe-hydrogenase I cytochrome b subunit
LARQLEQLDHVCIITFILLAIICLVIQYRYYQRLRILQAVAANGVQLLPRTAAFELKPPNTTEQPTTISYLQTVAHNLDQIRHIDFMLAALCFTALILTVIFTIVIKRIFSRCSFAETWIASSLSSLLRNCDHN